jgi:hypothetical protein
VPEARDFGHALLLIGGLIAIGLLNRILRGAGYPTLGLVTWVGGYAALVLIAWYRWIRPLDLGPPSPDAPEE